MKISIKLLNIIRIFRKIIIKNKNKKFFDKEDLT